MKPSPTGDTSTNLIVTGSLALAFVVCGAVVVLVYKLVHKLTKKDNKPVAAVNGRYKN